MMTTLPISLPIRLLKQAQSPRLSVPKRLRAVGELAQDIDQAGMPKSTPLGQFSVSPPQKLADAVDVATLLTEAAQLVRCHLLPRIKRYHAQIVTIDQLTEPQRSWLGSYFQHQIYPLLTPLAVDSGHPFPYLQGRRLNFLVVLQGQNPQGRTSERYGVVQIPARLPRLIQAQPCLPQRTRRHQLRCLLWREEIVRAFLPLLFSGLQVMSAYQFRLLRASNEGSATAPTYAQRPGIPAAPIIRLDIEKAMPAPLRAWLINHLQVPPERIVDCPTPLGLDDLCELADYLMPPTPAHLV
ncbi:MAG: hypothetical protein KF832_10555 [Caldilineaceae bacterium]|nr:hypothetical protein [Caldilineaceae bacterium]